MLAALAIYAAGAGLALALVGNEPAPATTAAPVPTTGNWQVTEGTLSFTIRQMGGEVKGSFATWVADITFDEPTGSGSVVVTIDMTSLSLGSVTDQAKGASFLDTASHPTATFAATIRPANRAFVAEGTLMLRGQKHLLSLPFSLTSMGGKAQMTGKVSIDRRAFGIGAKYPDEATVGFAADVTVALRAKRKD